MAWVAAAIVFVALLYLFPRFIGLVVAAVVACRFATGAYFWFSSNLDEQAKSKVVITIALNQYGCALPLPVFISIVNESNRTVSAIDYGVGIHRKGFSDQIGTLPIQRSDKILGPSHSYALCYGVPPLSKPAELKDLDFALTYKFVSWQNP